MKIPVIINNRNLLTWTRAMVERIKRYENVGDIIIVDNGSTYEPLLEWYKEGSCDVMMRPNLGHTAPWLCGVVESLKCDYYVVSDPDLGLENTPDDTLTVLEEELKSNTKLGKVGLGLEWRAVMPESPYFHHIQNYEKNRWESSTVIRNERYGVYYGVGIDTTFALYPAGCKHHFTGGVSLSYPYVAKHYPWYYTAEERVKDEEFSYYLRHANGSCSYVRIGGGSVPKISVMKNSNPELYNTDKFGVEERWDNHHYDGFYDELLWNRRNNYITIMEVGTWKGGAVRLFHDYLPNSQVYGIDTNLLWTNVNDYPRLRLYNFNAYDVDNWKKIPNAVYDIIIDDGPHSYESQLDALHKFPMFLADDGILIIEDVPNYTINRILENFQGDKKRLKVHNWSWITGKYDDVIITYQ